MELITSYDGTFYSNTGTTTSVSNWSGIYHGISIYTTTTILPYAGHKSTSTTQSTSYGKIGPITSLTYQDTGKCLSFSTFHTDYTTYIDTDNTANNYTESVAYTNILEQTVRDYTTDSITLEYRSGVRSPYMPEQIVLYEAGLKSTYITPDVRRTKYYEESYRTTYDTALSKTVQEISTLSTEYTSEWNTSIFSSGIESRFNPTFVYNTGDIAEEETTSISGNTTIEYTKQWSAYTMVGDTEATSTTEGYISSYGTKYITGQSNDFIASNLYSTDTYSDVLSEETVYTDELSSYDDYTTTLSRDSNSFTAGSYQLDSYNIISRTDTRKVYTYNFTYFVKGTAGFTYSTEVYSYSTSSYTTDGKIYQAPYTATYTSTITDYLTSSTISTSTTDGTYTSTDISIYPAYEYLSAVDVMYSTDLITTYTFWTGYTHSTTTTFTGEATKQLLTSSTYLDEIESKVLTVNTYYSEQTTISTYTGSSVESYPRYITEISTNTTTHTVEDAGSVSYTYTSTFQHGSISGTKRYGNENLTVYTTFSIYDGTTTGTSSTTVETYFYGE